jgi:hypothetical protein
MSGSLSESTNFTLQVNAPGFALFPAPSSLAMEGGSSASTTITVTDYAGFAGNVVLTVTSPLPSGVTAVWSNKSANGSSTLTLTASGSAGLTTNTITITGTSGNLMATSDITLQVLQPSFSINVSPIPSFIAQGATVKAIVTLVPKGNYMGSADLFASSLPAGVTATFSPSSIKVGGASQVTFTASNSATLGLAPYYATLYAFKGSRAAGILFAMTITTLQTPSVSISAASQFVTVPQGGTVTDILKASGANGFNGSVTIFPGQPSGLTASVSPNPTTGSAVLTLTASPTAPLGFSGMSFYGQSGSQQESMYLFLLVTPPRSDFALSAAQSSLAVGQGASTSTAITVTPQGGFAGRVSLAVTSVLPNGVTASFGTSTAVGSSVLTLNASNTALRGHDFVNISGTSGGNTITMSLPLEVEASIAPTATTLSIAPVGNPQKSGSFYTLTGKVMAGLKPATQGEVSLCDASSTYCTDIHLFGTARVNSAGTATLKFHPSAGTHTYTAVYSGTPKGSPAYAKSTSVPASLTVIGSTHTAIAASGSAGNYSLTGTVSNIGSATAPAGIVSFLDTSNNNAVLGSASLGAGIANLSFTNSSNPAANGTPDSVAVGDFNDDGNLDLAVANLGNNTVKILLGKGDGTFTAASVSPSTGTSPQSLTVGDFNGDGKLDLAVANTGSDTVTLLLGHGDGSFTAAADSPATGHTPWSIVAGDFNHDGNLDVATANQEGNSVTILLGKGDGTFTVAQNIPTTGLYPIAIAAGDFNGDGNLDLVVANQGSGTLMVLSGDGEGTFAAQQDSPYAGLRPWCIAVGDFNKDGKSDLAVVNSGDNNVIFLLGNGDGTFTTAPDTAPTGLDPTSIAVGDFNGDGNLDLVFANTNGNSAAVLLGRGDGTFASPQNVPATYNSPVSIAVGDFNGDGVADLVAANANANNVSVIATNLTETATASVSGIAVPGLGTHAVDANYPGNKSYSSSVSATTSLAAGVLAAMPTFNPALGTFTTPQMVTISDATARATIYFTTNGNTPTTNSTKYTGPIKVSATETLEAMAVAAGYLNSAVATAKYTLVAATPSFSPAAGTFNAAPTVAISSATPGAIIYYTANGTTPTTNSTKYIGPIKVSATETLEAIAAATGYSNSAVATAKYTLVAATPTFSPARGTFNAPQTAAISSTTPGATVYYTTNGTTPTTNSTKYTGPIKVAMTQTLEAIAVETGYSSSTVATAKYTLVAATPTFSLAAGTFNAPQTVTISSVTPGARASTTPPTAPPRPLTPSTTPAPSRLPRRKHSKPSRWQRVTQTAQ